MASYSILSKEGS